MQYVAKAIAALLLMLLACQAHAAKLTELRVVQENLKAGLWSIRVEPYKSNGKTIAPPPSSGCATVEQLLDKIDLPLAYRTDSRKELADVPTVITKNGISHGAVQITIPPSPQLGMPHPTIRTLDIKQLLDKKSFLFIVGPGNLTTVRVTYLGKCVP